MWINAFGTSDQPCAVHDVKQVRYSYRASACVASGPVPRRSAAPASADAHLPTDDSPRRPFTQSRSPDSHPSSSGDILPEHYDRIPTQRSGTDVRDSPPTRPEEVGPLPSGHPAGTTAPPFTTSQRHLLPAIFRPRGRRPAPTCRLRGPATHRITYTSRFPETVADTPRRGSFQPPTRPAWGV